MDYSIKIGGEAGQGIQTIGDTLSKVFSRAGYHVFTHQDYESRIRGGHNFFQIRFSDKPVTASRDRIDIIVALDKESISLHERELSENGLIICDSSALKQKHEKPYFLDIPFIDLAQQHGNKIMVNTVATGAVLGMLRLDLDILNNIMHDTFKKKGEDLVQANIMAAKAGHAFALENCPKCSFIPSSVSGAKMLIAGIEAIALGAIASGCKFYSAYPMTPSTGIMNYLAGKEKEYGIVVEQAEDEIAAINMALGASFAGVRAMTGTAGGGFALMAEGLSLAGMTETPIVIAVGQRPAPATGLPTRTEQGDLLFCLHAAHGEFSRVIFAPGTPEQAFYLTIKAFDMAEKYQIPAFIIFDQYLADTTWTYDKFELSKLQYNDYRLRGDAFRKLDSYNRHTFTDTGISPLAVPGDSNYLVVTDSDEHDEEGHITEDSEIRIKMVQKRLLKKLPIIKEEIEAPILYGSKHPEILITGWGSTYGVMKEAVDILSRDRSVALMHFSEIYPLPSTEKFDYLALLSNAKMSISVENNATGQFARLIMAETGYEFSHRINKYDGRPFTVEGLLGELDACIGRL
ncbi:MAG: 2-oxoacid:acceptor oxidoreductase subunit alpha [Nitrospira sp.]|nr:2-oxoacid:acceptor oxidoreductase subunit alpha [Nitrospira sp.]